MGKKSMLHRHPIEQLLPLQPVSQESQFWEDNDKVARGKE
jgi:hypothetical protein